MQKSKYFSNLINKVNKGSSVIQIMPISCEILETIDKNFLLFCFVYADVDRNILVWQAAIVSWYESNHIQ